MSGPRNSDDPNDLRGWAWPDSVSRPLGNPLQPSVVYVSATPDETDAQYDGSRPGYTYAREGHPNAEVLARRLDAMEGARDGLVTGSGMAAVGAVLLGLTRAGDHVIGGNQLYGRSLRMLREDLPRLGVQTDFFDPTRPETLSAILRPQTRMVLIEAVSNPTLRVADVTRIAEITREHGCLLFLDNTFTTPRAVRAFDIGADIVMHSVTKLLAGHSDVTLGYVACRDSQTQEQVRAFATTLGMTASPFDCWLAERGLATFDLRFERACANAVRLADLLAEAPQVAQVLYPGRADHPDHTRAAALFGPRFGNMVTFRLNGGRAAANALTRAAGAFPLAPTLGDVATTLSHPASSSHRGLSPEARSDLGITEGMFRLSVGVEDPEWLCAQLGDALRTL